jgi:hypothetical protein
LKDPRAVSAQFIRVLRQALESIHEERSFQDERGFQGALLQELGRRWQPGAEDPIIDQEYQKRLKNHGIRIRPDVILHVPFERGVAERRNEGNFAVIELKRRATTETARQAFESLALMKKKLKYPLTIFINVDSEQALSGFCPASIRNQTVCFAVRLEGGSAVVREEKCGK